MSDFDPADFAAAEPSDWLWAADSPFGEKAGLQTKETMPRARRTEVRDVRRTAIFDVRRTAAIRDLMSFPEPGSAIHLLANGDWDGWSVVEALFEIKPQATALSAYFSTWTVNKYAVQSLLALMDAGRIRKAGFLTCLYFVKREPTARPA